MIDKLKAKLADTYQSFLLDFADPATVDRKKFLDLEFNISDLFKQQRHLSEAREKLGKDGSQELFALYFDSYRDKPLEIAKDLHRHHPIFIRGLGKDKVNKLQEILSILECIEDKRKGLLFEHTS